MANLLRNGTHFLSPNITQESQEMGRLMEDRGRGSFYPRHMLAYTFFCIISFLSCLLLYSTLPIEAQTTPRTLDTLYPSAVYIIIYKSTIRDLLWSVTNDNDKRKETRVLVSGPSTAMLTRISYTGGSQITPHFAWTLNGRS